MSRDQPEQGKTTCPVYQAISLLGAAIYAAKAATIVDLDFSQATDCDGARCAWYNESSEQCAIVDIGNGLYRLATRPL